MISQIKGKIVDHSDKYLIIEVNGLGFKVFSSEESINTLLNNESGEVLIHTYLSVKETSIELFGFSSIVDLNFFEMLIGVSGIGPKSAISILNIAPVETIKKAIISGDITSLIKISGIGKKTAEKISLELKEKIKDEMKEGEDYDIKGEADAIEALKALGFGQKEVREALKEVSNDLNTSEKIKQVLKILNSKHD